MIRKMLKKAFYKFLSTLTIKQSRGVWQYIMTMLNTKGEGYLTYHSRPKFSKDISTWSDILKKMPRFAIVIQGPIDKENDFTLETVRIYKKHFKNAIIILSTWENENKEYLVNFEKEEIFILLNKLPEYVGEKNINLQIVSSFTGMQKARELKAEYAMKTRTDQRIYSLSVYEFLYNMIKAFPLKYKNEQKERLVGISINTFKYRLYNVSDMGMFGNIDDMLLYWGVELDNRGPESFPPYVPCRTLLELAKLRVAESYLETEFFKKINRNFDFTLKDSWKAYAEHFIIVDKESLDLFWKKYGNKEYRWLAYVPKAYQELSFKEWFNLYSNISNKEKIPENVLDIDFYDTIKPDAFS